MSAATLDRPGLQFELPPELEAHEPPEARGIRRDGVRLLVSPGEERPIHAKFGELPRFLSPGDLVVVNTSGTPVPTQDTDERARQPVTITTNVTVLANAENGFNFGIYTVPAAKRLVIEYVTAAGPFTDPEEMFSLSLNIEGGSAPLLYIPVTVSGGLAPNPSAHRMFASQAVVMYANPGDILDAGVHTNAGSVGDSAGVFFTIYGHLVNLP